jgi:hypothetical protein
MGNQVAKIDSKEPLKILEKEIKAAGEQAKYAGDISTEIKELLESTYKSERNSLIYYIKLGKLLLTAKVRLGPSFKLLIPEDLIPAKQTQRYIRLILDKAGETKYGTCKTFDDFKEVTLDKRVIGLIEKADNNELEKFNNPTMAKVKRMKLLKVLEDEDGKDKKDLFNEVVNGVDSILDDSDNFPPPETTTTATPVENKKKPAGMEKDEFEKLAKKSVYELIESIQEERKKNEEQAKKVKANAKAASKHRLALEKEIKLRKEKEDELKQIKDLSIADDNKPENGKIGAN